MSISSSLRWLLLPLLALPVANGSSAPQAAPAAAPPAVVAAARPLRASPGYQALVAACGFALSALAPAWGWLMLGRVLTGIGVAAGLTAMS